MYYCQFQDGKYGRGETILDTMMGISYKKIIVKIKWELKTHLQLLAQGKKLCIVNKIPDVLWLMTIE